MGENDEIDNWTSNADFVLLSDGRVDDDCDAVEYQTGIIHSSLQKAAETFRQRKNPLNYKDPNIISKHRSQRRSPSIYTNKDKILETSKCDPIEDNLKNHLKIIKKSTNKIRVAVLVALILIFIFIHNKTRYTPIQEPINVNCNEIFATIENRFPNQNVRLWASLKIGIEGVNNYGSYKKSPAIFLLAYNDIETIESILKEIIFATAKCLNAHEKPLQLTATDFSSYEMQQDYGVAIEKFRIPLKKSGILVVNDIDQVPFTVAEAFHSICDSEQPLVDRSVIFLTQSLKLATNDLPKSNNVERYVSDNLRKAWQKIEKNKLEALITRVTDQILLLNDEP